VGRPSVPAPERCESCGVAAQSIPDAVWQHKTQEWVAPFVKDLSLREVALAPDVAASLLTRARENEETWAHFQILAEEIKIHRNVI